MVHRCKTGSWRVVRIGLTLVAFSSAPQASYATVPLSPPPPLRSACDPSDTDGGCHADRRARIDLTGSAPRFDRQSPIQDIRGQGFTPVPSASRPAPGPTPEPPAPQSKDFRFLLELPIEWTSGVSVAGADGTPLQTGAWHGTPDITLKWSHQFANLKISASLGLTSDRYYQEADYDANTVEGTIKLLLTDGNPAVLVPYFKYTGRIDIAGQFDGIDDTTQDMSLGAISGFGLAPDGKLLSFSDASDAGDGSLGIDLRAGHRFSDSGDLRMFFAQIELPLEYVVDDDLTMDLTPSFQMRFYDQYYLGYRRDWKAGAELKVLWSPDWLRSVLPGGELNTRINYLSSVSNIVGKSYSLWDIGPSIALESKF